MNLRLEFLTILIFFILTFLVFAFWNDWHQYHFYWHWFWRRPFFLGLLASLGSYFFRFWRWDFFLRRVLARQKKAPAVTCRQSAFIFLSGLATVVTPLRTGEVLKPWLVKQLTGVRASKTLAVVVFERFTDALAMLLLMSLGVLRFRFGAPLLVGVFILGALFIASLRFPGHVERLLNWPQRWLGKRYRYFSHRLLNLYRQSVFLSYPKPLILGVLLGLLGWGVQMTGSSYLVAQVVGRSFTGGWLLATFFIFSFSAALGFGIPLPGGIGIAEPTVAGLLVALLHVPAGSAVAATLLVRFSTLWFGVLLGLFSFQVYKIKYK